MLPSDDIPLVEYKLWIAEVHRLFKRYFQIDSTEWDVSFLKSCWEDDYTPQEAVDEEIGNWMPDMDLAN